MRERAYKVLCLLQRLPGNARVPHDLNISRNVVALLVLIAMYKISRNIVARLVLIVMYKISRNIVALLVLIAMYQISRNVVALLVLITVYMMLRIILSESFIKISLLFICEERDVIGNVNLVRVQRLNE